MRSHELPRNLAILDTNVLISHVDPEDSLHRETAAVLDMAQFSWAVATPTLIEAWNLLVGKRKRPDLAYFMMDWILTPGAVVSIPDDLEPVGVAHDISKRMKVDIVDAGIISLADRITKLCEMRPAVHVATYDTRDFLRAFGTSGSKFNVYDFHHLSSTAELAED